MFTDGKMLDEKAILLRVKFPWLWKFPWLVISVIETGDKLKLFPGIVNIPMPCVNVQD